MISLVTKATHLLVSVWELLDYAVDLGLQDAGLSLRELDLILHLLPVPGLPTHGTAEVKTLLQQRPETYVHEG